MLHSAKKICLGVVATALVVGMAVAPQSAFEGARLGLGIWWDTVVPALLPFFIAAEIVMGLGVVHLMGMLLEPLMRPVFALPGAASFALAVGYTSGYPVGAAVAARLRQEGLLTRDEAERVVSFCNNASPLFMLVAVSVGMFGNAAFGPFILAIHYVSNLFIGFVLGRLAPRRATQRARLHVAPVTIPPLGRMLGDAVSAATKKILQVGGFIILFAVVIALARRFGLLDIPIRCLENILTASGLTPELAPPLVSGFFEMTLGTRLAAEATAPLVHKLVAVEAVLAWSGLSIHAQIAAFVAETDIRLRTYYLSRVGHVVLATWLTLLLFPCFEPYIAAAVATAEPVQVTANWWNTLLTATLWACVAPALLLLGGGTCYLGRRLLHLLLHIFEF